MSCGYTDVRGVTGLSSMNSVFVLCSHSNTRVRGLAPKVPIFHRFDPSWASLGLSEVAEGLSGRLGVWYPCGYELVAWYGREYTRLVLRRSLTSLRPSVRREARENGRRNTDLVNGWEMCE